MDICRKRHFCLRNGRNFGQYARSEFPYLRQAANRISSGPGGGLRQKKRRGARAAPLRLNFRFSRPGAFLRRLFHFRLFAEADRGRRRSYFSAVRNSCHISSSSSGLCITRRAVNAMAQAACPVDRAAYGVCVQSAIALVWAATAGSPVISNIG